MKNKRRDFLKYSGLTSLGVAGGFFNGFGAYTHMYDLQQTMNPEELNHFTDDQLNMIGLYGPWAVSLTANKLPSFSFRNPDQTDIESWRPKARQLVVDRMAVPDIGHAPEYRVVTEWTRDGLSIKELEWQLPYGRPTRALLLKPADAKKPLPAVLAFHDHGGNKYFGYRKITSTGDAEYPLIVAHQKEYYSGLAWANGLAKKGYVVLVPDAFAFASRRVMLKDVPISLRKELNDEDPDDPAHIEAYNEWASAHEAIMAKSLFCAGTTWPAVFFAEDRIALDILCPCRMSIQNGLDARDFQAVDYGRPIWAVSIPGSGAPSVWDS